MASHHSKAIQIQMQQLKFVYGAALCLRGEKAVFKGLQAASHHAGFICVSGWSVATTNHTPHAAIITEVSLFDLTTSSLFLIINIRLSSRR